MEDPIKKVTVYYSVNKSHEIPPKRGDFHKHKVHDWPKLHKGEYLWLRTEVVFTDGNTVCSEPTVAYEGIL